MYLQITSRRICSVFFPGTELGFPLFALWKVGMPFATPLPAPCPQSTGLCRDHYKLLKMCAPSQQCQLASSAHLVASFLVQWTYACSVCLSVPLLPLSSCSVGILHSPRFCYLAHGHGRPDSSKIEAEKTLTSWAFSMSFGHASFSSELNFAYSYFCYWCTNWNPLCCFSTFSSFLISALFC